MLLDFDEDVGFDLAGFVHQLCLVKSNILFRLELYRANARSYLVHSGESPIVLRLQRSLGVISCLLFSSIVLRVIWG